LRPLETLLLGAELLAFLALALPLASALHWTKYAVHAAALIALAKMLMEVDVSERRRMLANLVLA
jgi:hypothetical protein